MLAPPTRRPVSRRGKAPHWLMSSSSRDTYAAFAALNIMRMADQELDKYRGANVEFIEELQRIKPIYDDKPPISITDGYIRPALPITTHGEEVHDE